MKKIIFSLIASLLVIGGLVYAGKESNNKSEKKAIAKPPTAAEMKASRKKWEASPDGIKFKEWEASPAGIKVHTAMAKIRIPTKDFGPMEATVTSLSLPAGSRLGYGLMVRIYDEEYLLSFGLENNKEFEALRSLQVHDKIIIRSHGLMYAPKYAYPIVAGEYIEKDAKMIYKRPARKGGC